MSLPIKKPTIDESNTTVFKKAFNAYLDAHPDIKNYMIEHRAYREAFKYAWNTRAEIAAIITDKQTGS
jgi:putative salt-induced outer membrane protein YdiY